MTVHNKTVGLGALASFELQYVPQLGQTTEPGGPGGSGLRAGPAPPVAAALAPSAAERRGLAALALAAALVGGVAWLGAGPAGGLLAAVRVAS